MFREGVLAFLGVKPARRTDTLAGGEEKPIQSKYCAACKKAKMVRQAHHPEHSRREDNCETCTRNFEIIH